MGYAGSLVVLICAWWMVFFMVLPIGIRSQWEDGEVTDGTEPGSPIQHNLRKKALWATIGAVAIWAVAWTVVSFDLIPIERPNWAYGANAASETDE